MATEMEYIEYITCPYCGDVREDWCNYPWGSDFETDGDMVGMECGNCGEEFVAKLNVTHDFSTYQKKPEPEGENGD